MKGKSRDPYLKFVVHTEITVAESKGSTYVDMDQKFHWYADEEVIEL